MAGKAEDAGRRIANLRETSGRQPTFTTLRYATCGPAWSQKHSKIEVPFCFSATDPIAPAALETAISALQASLGADLLRIKGLVEINDHHDTPCVLHVVGHVASPLRRLDGWPEGVDATRLVMIVAGPGRHVAPEMLARFLPELTPFNPSTSS